MKKINKKSLWLLITGILVLSATTILKHYFNLSDLVNGILNGMGISILTVSIISASRNQHSKASK